MGDHRLLFPLLLFFCAIRCASANVYSCEEIREPLLWSSFAPSLTYACVILQEGYTNYDQLKRLQLGSDKIVDFAGIARDITHCAAKSQANSRWKLMSDGKPIDCSQEFTLIMSSELPSFIIPKKEPRSFNDLYGTNVVVVPQTGIYLGTSCEGSGNVTISTGAGKGEAENRFSYRTWPCDSLPSIIFSYDNVITITADDSVILYKSSIGSLPIALDWNTTVFPGDRIAILSSGRSDNLQNLEGTHHATAFTMDRGLSADVTATMNLTFDSTNNGWISIIANGGFSNSLNLNGSYATKFNTDYFEVHYYPLGLKPSEISSNNDNIVIELSVGSSGPTVAPQTTPLPKTSKQEPYCPCEVDKFGLPDGWNPSEIWLDIVVILDTSEAMGQEHIDDAEVLIESFLSDGYFDFLSTDSEAKYFTRLGVVSMPDQEVIYNLNMTSSDKMQGKTKVKQGVREISLSGAFEVAKDMLSNGLKSHPERSNTRPVVYYMSASNEVNYLSSITQFKSNQGIIIVNEFANDGGKSNPNLKGIASDGYYFVISNYMQGLQAFCKANCYCRNSNMATNGKTASGGCYGAFLSGVPFNKAKSACANQNGFLATVHNEEKEQFLQQLMTTSNSDYFWIGYDKSDDGVWQWEDESTDSYTNWGVNEPSTASVAKCAYLDASDAALSWGAGNCQIGFPYVCQSAPCSAGYNDC